MPKTLDEYIDQIRVSAKKHNGNYLLPRRYGVPILNKSETDYLWDAAEKLVNDKEAYWISPYSSLHPGIRLRNVKI